jgi:hypothetical protein
MRLTSFTLLLALAASLHARQPAVSQTPVATEFRVFAGREEITPTIRLRIVPSGTRDAITPVGPGKRLTVSLAPGIYDVQAFRTRQDAVVGIKWMERLVVMHYPDEGGRHLEVINFEPGFGALLVRSQKNPIATYAVDVFPAGQRTPAPWKPSASEDSLLFVLEARRYDIRVRPAGARDDPDDTNWFLDIEVPSDRTRLKLIDQ